MIFPIGGSYCLKRASVERRMREINPPLGFCGAFANYLIAIPFVADSWGEVDFLLSDLIVCEHGEREGKEGGCPPFCCVKTVFF